MNLSGEKSILREKKPAENSAGEEIAKVIFHELKDTADRMKSYGIDTEKASIYVFNQIKNLEQRENILTTHETFEKIKSMITEEFSRKGGIDEVVSRMLDILSLVEKKLTKSS